MAKSKKGKRKKRGPSELLEWKVKYKVSTRLMDETGLSAEELKEQALDYYQEHGEQMPGVHITGLWRNPDNKNPRHADWKTSDDFDQTLDGFFKTIVQRTGHSIEGRTGTVVSGGGRHRPEPSKRPKRGKYGPVNVKAAAMRDYHTRVRAERAKHPGMSYAAARGAVKAKKGGRR